MTEEERYQKTFGELTLYLRPQKPTESLDEYRGVVRAFFTHGIIGMIELGGRNIRQKDEPEVRQMVANVMESIEIYEVERKSVERKKGEQ